MGSVASVLPADDDPAHRLIMQSAAYLPITSALPPMRWLTPASVAGHQVGPAVEPYQLDANSATAHEDRGVDAGPGDRAAIKRNGHVLSSLWHQRRERDALSSPDASRGPRSCQIPLPGVISASDGARSVRSTYLRA